jgi:hypothetical protein
MGNRRRQKIYLGLSCTLPLSSPFSHSRLRAEAGDVGRGTAGEATTPTRVWLSVACGLRRRDEAPVLHDSKRREVPPLGAKGSESLSYHVEDQFLPPSLSYPSSIRALADCFQYRAAAIPQSLVCHIWRRVPDTRLCY